MKVCGFTFVRNGVKYSYPVVESIESLLPLCDQVVVAVGNSKDGTLDLIRGINSSKIRIIETVWDESLREGGRVLAVETNKAFDAIPPEYDWCIYAQADEVIHEDGYPAIRLAMEQWLNSTNVEGLLLRYKHFWGTYDYVGINRHWYRNEIRVIRNDKQIRSFRDAQGFRKNNRKLKVKPVDAFVFHYGWVRPPAVMVEKMKDFTLLYHPNEYLDKISEKLDNFKYDEVNGVKRFEGTHPSVMSKRINSIEWKVNIDEKKKKKCP